jgi:hypothetical protein
LLGWLHNKISAPVSDLCIDLTIQFMIEAEILCGGVGRGRRLNEAYLCQNENMVKAVSVLMHAFYHSTRMHYQVNAENVPIKFEAMIVGRLYKHNITKSFYSLSDCQAFLNKHLAEREKELKKNNPNMVLLRLNNLEEDEINNLFKSIQNLESYLDTHGLVELSKERFKKRS